MPGQNIIDLGFDIEKFDEQKQHIATELQNLYETATKISSAKVNVNATSGGWNELKNQMQVLAANVGKLVESNQKYLTQQAQIAQSTAKVAGETKTATDATNQYQQAKDRLAKAESDDAKQAAIANQARQEVVKNLRIQAQLEVAVAGSIGEAQAQVSKYYQEIKSLNLGLEEDRKKHSELITEINRLNRFINENSDALTKQKRNVGNYTGAFNILKTELEQAQIQMQKLTQAGQQESEQGQKLASEIELLTTLVAQQDKGFSSLTREVTNLGKALATMHEQGLQNTQAFANLEKEFVGAKQRLTEFNNEQKILTSTTPKLTALTAAARGLGGIYAAGAGASALFADGNEHVQKELNKLVAVMTLLQGLTELHHFLMEKNAIATALFGTSVTTTTVALEGEAVAATEAGAATTIFGKALAFIAANPIVLVLAGLTAAIALLVTSLKDEEYQFKKTAEAAQDYSDAVKDSADATSQLSRLKTKDLQDQKTDLQHKQALAVSEAERLSIGKQIADIDTQITAQNLKDHPKLNDELKEQTNIYQDYLKKQVDGADEIEHLTELKRKGQKEEYVLLRDLTAAEKKRYEGVIFSTRQLSAEEKKRIEEVNKRQGVTSPIVSLGRVDNRVEEEKKRQEEIKKTVDKSKAAIDELNRVKDENDKAEQDRLKQQQDSRLYYSDEERKLLLATAQAEVQSTQAKNALILNNERSTFEQRLGALQSNAAALRKAALAEELNVTKNPKSSTNDRAIAEQQYADKQKEITASSEAEIQKLRDDYGKRNLESLQKINTARLSAEKQADEVIITNEALTIDQRLAAQADYFNKSQEEIIADAQFQKQTKILTDQEIVALDLETKNKLIDLAHKQKEETSRLIAEAAKQQIADYAEAEAQISSIQRSRALAQTTTPEEAKQVNRTFDVKDDLAAIHRLEVARQINLAILADRRVTEKDAVAAAKAAEDEYVQIEKSKADAVVKAEEEKRAVKKRTHELEKELADKSIDLIQTLVDSGYERQKNAIQTLINANNDYAAAEQQRIQNSTLSEQDKAAKTIQLQAWVDAKNKQLQRAQKEEDIKKAKFDKAASIAKIIERTAVAIISTLAEIPPPAGLPLAYLVGAIGAVELATAVATPIPTYSEGTDEDDAAKASPATPGTHPGGPAIVGERKDKKPELVKEPTGRSYVVSKPTLVKDMPKGSVVIPLVGSESETKTIIEGGQNKTDTVRRTHESVQTGYETVQKATESGQTILQREVDRQVVGHADFVREAKAYAQGTTQVMVKGAGGAGATIVTNNIDASKTDIDASKTTVLPAKTDGNQSRHVTTESNDNRQWYSTSTEKREHVESPNFQVWNEQLNNSIRTNQAGDINGGDRVNIVNQVQSSEQNVNKVIRQIVPVTAQQIDDAMYGSAVKATEERLALVEAVESREYKENWRIAQWQAREMKKAMVESNGKKQSIKVPVTVNVDMQHASWVNRQVFGRE